MLMHYFTVLAKYEVFSITHGILTNMTRYLGKKNGGWHFRNKKVSLGCQK